MADVTPILINQLAAQTTLSDSDYFIVGGSDAKKITVAQMKEALGINALNGKLKGITVTPDPSATNYLRVARSRFAVYGNMIVADIAIDVLQNIGKNNNAKIFTAQNINLKYEYDFQAIVTNSKNEFATSCGLIYKPDGCYLDNNPELQAGQKISAIIVIPDIYLN